MKNLLEFDRKHLYHPYASTTEPPPVLEVRRAEGVFIELADGRKMIDGVSSWWCVAHGHGHPAIVAAMERQLKAFSQVMFAGFTHGPAAELAEKLLTVYPGMDRVFYVDSGSVAAEVAVKMAIQYQFARGRGGRRKLAALRGGYHGDTLGAMALCDPEGMHGMFTDVLAAHHFLPRPKCVFDASWDGGGEVAAALSALDSAEIAGVIAEPVFQGAGGMRFYHPDYLKLLRAWCDAHDVLLIFDEIASGFGRTGRMFAAEHANVAPDLVLLGKGLTGGAVGLAAVLCAERVAAAISGGKPGKFMHGPTFMANPLACAAGCASLDLFAAGAWRTHVPQLENQLRQELEPARGRAGVRDVRVLGAVGVIELETPLDPARILPTLLEHGVWLRPFGNYLYTMPPLVTEAKELSRVTACMNALLEKC